MYIYIKLNSGFYSTWILSDYRLPWIYFLETYFLFYDLSSEMTKYVTSQGFMVKKKINFVIFFFYWSTTRGLPCLAKSVHSLPVVAEQAVPYSPASHSSCLIHPAPQTRPAPPCISEHSGDGEPFSCLYEGVALTYSVSCICRTFILSAVRETVECPRAKSI